MPCRISFPTAWAVFRPPGDHQEFGEIAAYRGVGASGAEIDQQDADPRRLPVCKLTVCHDRRLEAARQATAPDSTIFNRDRLLSARFRRKHYLQEVA